MSKKIEKNDTQEMIDVKLVWHSSWVNIKYEWWIIEMKNNVVITVSLDVYENVLAKLKWYKVIKA